MNELNAYRCETCEHLSNEDYPAGSGYRSGVKGGKIAPAFRRGVELPPFVMY